MSPVSPARNPLSDWFDYVYTYFYSPTSNLQHAFSPTINFGCNVEDAPTEQHVVNSVGSYGFQLNRALDALSVILDHSSLEGLSADEKKKIAEFKKLAKAADDAAREYQGQATETGVAKLIKSMHELKQTDRVLYKKLKDELLAEIE